MKLPTSLLFDLGRSGIDGATAEPSDETFSVPPILVPTVQLCKPHSPGFIVSGTAGQVQRTSFSALAAATQLGVQPEFTVDACTFSKGLWDVYFALSSMSDFSIVINFAARVFLREPGGIPTTIAHLFPQANVAQGVSARLLWLFDRDNWKLRLNLQATAAGQNLHGQLVVNALLLT